MLARKFLSVIGVLSLTVALAAQGAGSGTPNQLRVITDANGYLVVSGGAQTLPLSSPQVFTNTRLVTDANGYLVVTLSSVNGAITINVNGIATTSTDGLVLANNTASTAGVPVQMSPREKFCGTAWNSVGLASETDCWILETLPSTAGPTSSQFNISRSIAGGAYINILNITSAGSTTFTNNIFATGIGTIGWIARAQETSPADGQLNITNAGTTTGIGFDVTTDGQLKIRNRAQNAYANLVASILYPGTSIVYGNGTTTIINAPADAQLSITNNGATAGVGLDVSTNSLLKVRTTAQTGDGNISFGAATASGTITTAANGTTTTPITLTHGTLLSTPTADALENDAVSFYNTIDTTNGRRASDGWNYFRLTGSGSGITTIADFFGATGSGIPLVANGVYEIEWHCYFSQATAGTATWTIVTATTNLANLTGEYVGSPIAGITPVGTPQTAGINVTNTGSTAFPVTGTEANGATHYFVIHVMLTAGNGASNTRLRLTMSAGTATPLINSYFKVRRLPAGNTGTYVS